LHSLSYSWKNKPIRDFLYASKLNFLKVNFPDNRNPNSSKIILLNNFAQRGLLPSTLKDALSGRLLSISHKTLIVMPNSPSLDFWLHTILTSWISKAHQHRVNPNSSLLPKLFFLKFRLQVFSLYFALNEIANNGFYSSIKRNLLYLRQNLCSRFDFCRFEKTFALISLK
jgi:hypothetical protein